MVILPETERGRYMKDDASAIIVSVIIPVYNEEKHIEGVIKSLINQTYPCENMEWIFVDGYSSDKTQEIIESYQNEYPIRLIINKIRKTPSSLNLGIRTSRGKYIIRMDAHALFPTDYISNCINVLEFTGADNVGGYIETKAEGVVGRTIAYVLSTQFGVGGSLFRLGNKEGYVDTVPFGAFRREIFDKIGLFNEDLPRSEDNDINARITESGGKVYLSKCIHSIYYCRDSVMGILKQGILNGNALFKTLWINPSAMSIRHYIPFLFLLSLIILPLGSESFIWLKWIFVIELICYVTLDVVYSFKADAIELRITAIWLYPLFHMSYGIGSLLGLFGIDLTKVNNEINK